MVRHNILIFFGIICLLIVDNAIAVQLNQSVFDLEGQKIRYDVAASLNSDSSFNVEIKNDDSRVDSLKHRSPAKAFFMSLVVPGAGQFYNKSKLKSIGFFGVEVASWLLYSKWHSEADDMTDEFEKFNRDYWSEEDYDTLLSWTYGQTDDELVDAVEISHHLPDTRTQQYYEMTGKYDQFAWGWDDANLNGDSLNDYSSENPPPRLIDSVPTSENRTKYENMRVDTDARYKRARRMIFVSIANRLISAFEAFIATKMHNKHIDDQGGTVLSRIRLKASLKSYSLRQDTPFVTFTYKF